MYIDIMIILIGFSKAGTTSFNKLFKKLNLTTFHWKKNNEYIGSLIKKNKLEGKPLLNDFNDTDCITQMDICERECSYWPQLVDYKQLYYENPNSIFILNKRDPDKLLKSFKEWNGLYTRLHKYSPELIKDKTDEGFINFVLKHYSDVEKFFNSKKYAKFITYDIHNDTIDKLKKYIDIKDITAFPHENKRENKNNNK
jgi:hypothetical protein